MARAIVLAPCAALWGSQVGKCRGLGGALRCTGGSSGEQEEEGPLAVEVSTSVMSMLEGKKDPNTGGLIDVYQRKREQEEAAVSLREELFGSMDMCIPRHDTLFPLLVALLAVLGDEPGEGQSAMDRFTSTSTLSVAAAADAAWLRPSALFCDVCGETLNPQNGTRFERWLLFSMYIKFRLWWKGPSPASEAAQEFAYRVSNFVFDDDLEQRLLDGGFLPSRRVATRYGRLFVGKLTSQQQQQQPAASLLAALQARLDEAGSGLVAFLLNTGGGELACLLTHRTSMAFLALPGQPASSLLFGWSAAMAAAAAESDELWEQCAIPVGLLAAAGGGTLVRLGVAAIYRVTHLVSPPLPLPAAQLGAFPGPAVYYRGALPSRACLFDLSAAATVASLTAAAAILTAGCLLGPDMGCVSVSSSAVSYSGILTALLRWLSLSSSTVADGTEELLQVSPLALGGVLGLNLALASLLPIGTSDGGRIVSALYGRQALRLMSKVTMPAVTASLLLSGKPLLALSWLAVHSLLPDDSFQRDEVSQPGPIRAVLGLVLTGAALLGFVPVLGVF